MLVRSDAMYEFAFEGWRYAGIRQDGIVEVLTPRTSVGALQNGFDAVLHDSALTAHNIARTR